MTACSISEILAEGVDCDRWVWLVASLSCILVLGGMCCFLGFYWDTILCRRRRRGADPCLSSGFKASPVPVGVGRGAADAAPGGLPSVLHVASPTQQRECGGDYELVPQKQVNGQPLWKKRDGRRWLYSGYDGRWYICGPATQEQNFDCASGYLYNSRFHKGALPHQISGTWEWSGGLKWHRDPAISITVPCAPAPLALQPYPAASKRGLSSKTSAVSQASAALPGGEPFFLGPEKPPRAAGLKTQLGCGSLCESACPQASGSSKAVSADTGKRLKARLCVQNMMEKYRGGRKDDMSDVSTQDDSKSLQLDNCDTNTEHSAGSSSLCSPTSSSIQGLSTQSSSDSISERSSRRSMSKEPPKLLCVISPNGQRECAGIYELVPGGYANGFPLWKQQGGERWLYSGTLGRWCIGGPDVMEDNFQRNSGFVSQTVAHRGAMPDRTSSIWQRFDGTAFVKDDRINVVQLHGKRSAAEDSAAPAPAPRPGNATLDLRGKTTAEAGAREALEQKLRSSEVLSVVV